MQYNKTEKPLVSIITVVYNGENDIERTIKSVLSQSEENIEYIIIDGNSNDQTIEIINKYKDRIDKVISEDDEGIYDAMNKGIDIATGEWIIFMNAGDEFFNENSIKDVFFQGLTIESDIIFIYGNHQVNYKSGKSRIANAGNMKDIWKGSQFSHQSCFTRLAYHKLHKFNTSYKIAADFDFFYKSSKNGEKFKKINNIISIISAGGVSDADRVTSIIEWWHIIKRSASLNFYYICLLLIENIKFVLKKQNQ